MPRLDWGRDLAGYTNIFVGIKRTRDVKLADREFSHALAGRARDALGGGHNGRRGHLGAALAARPDRTRTAPRRRGAQSPAVRAVLAAGTVLRPLGLAGAGPDRRAGRPLRGAVPGCPGRGPGAGGGRLRRPAA